MAIKTRRESLITRVHDPQECAYRETIREADKIMSSHVTSYKQRIEELEASMEQQSSKIQQLEASEERLRANLRNNSRSSDGARISDLLDRLIETENSELKLKERVWGLERSEKELQIKVILCGIIYELSWKAGSSGILKGQ